MKYECGSRFNWSPYKLKVGLNTYSACAFFLLFFYYQFYSFYLFYFLFWLKKNSSPSCIYINLCAIKKLLLLLFCQSRVVIYIDIYIISIVFTLLFIFKHFHRLVCFSSIRYHKYFLGALFSFLAF